MIVVLDGAVNTIAGAAVTVKVALAVVLVAQELVTVQTTVADPPHANGAPVELFVTDKLQPPLLVTPASQVAYAVLIAVCVWQLATVVLDGAVNTIAGAAVTVNDALAV